MQRRLCIFWGLGRRSPRVGKLRARRSRSSKLGCKHNLRPPATKKQPRFVASGLIIFVSCATSAPRGRRARSAGSPAACLAIPSGPSRAWPGLPGQERVSLQLDSRRLCVQQRARCGVGELERPGNHAQETGKKETCTTPLWKQHVRQIPPPSTPPRSRSLSASVMPLPPLTPAGPVYLPLLRSARLPGGSLGPSADAAYAPAPMLTSPRSLSESLHAGARRQRSMTTSLRLSPLGHTTL